jgi:hypothetical protein
LGEVIDEQIQTIYNHFKSEIIKIRSEIDYYQKYPERIEENLETMIGSWKYEPQYSLITPTVNIESENIADFTKNEIPPDVKSIEMSVGIRDSPRKIEIILLIAGIWNLNKSYVNVSGIDSTWVFGTAERLKKIFMKRLLGYHYIVEKAVLRYILAILMWVSLSLALVTTIFQAISPFLKEGTSWITMFTLITIGFGGLTILGLERGVV